LVMASGRGENGLELATAAAQLNSARSAEGIPAFEGIARPSDVLVVVERMRAGAVPVAFVRGTNPAYALPKSARFADAFSKVPFKVSFSMFPDETTELCDLVLPDLHALESWGDTEPVRGTLGLQQPAMDPVFPGTRGTADVLMAAARNARITQPDYGAWVRSRLPGNTAALSAALAKGVVAGSLPARAVA